MMMMMMMMMHDESVHSTQQQQHRQHSFQQHSTQARQTNGIVRIDSVRQPSVGWVDCKLDRSCSTPFRQSQL